MLVFVLCLVSVQGALNDSTTSYWKMDEGTGTQVRDTVGAVNGTLSSSIWSAGIINNGVNFTGAGANTEFTPSTGANWAAVDDRPFSDADFVSGNVGQTDLYAFSDLPAGVGSVSAVQLTQRTRYTGAPINGRLQFKPASGAAVNFGSVITPGTGYVTGTAILSTNPATASAWTVSDINDGQFGITAVAP